ncbi:unnamed protein product [Fusarium fujikuroi]|uniref:Uncharacterized protein n=1 Tax=Fusarium fujikuroi TaxID=5127 RepID=A0A9Q9RUE9_FUSFU|nr:unnamed protein product [Fusarium fujikuroi]VTT76847.1 unnamed protein product [Fusarium fujikuroi]VZI22090.1 unnamed protein product [Fusarium fujikuroi]
MSGGSGPLFMFFFQLPCLLLRSDGHAPQKVPFKCNSGQGSLAPKNDLITHPQPYILEELAPTCSVRSGELSLQSNSMAISTTIDIVKMSNLDLWQMPL